MRKAYSAPEVKLAIHGTLEGVFASGVVCGRDKELSNLFVDSGPTQKVTLSGYCKDANTWMIDIDNSNSY